MKLLILHAHPRSTTSVVQRAMLRAIAGLEGVSLVDLYASYPNHDIDVDPDDPGRYKQSGYILTRDA